MLNKIAFKVALAGLMASLSGTVSALEDQWYLGIGGGISLLQPDTVDTTIDVDEETGQVATVFFGRDFDNRSSGQFQLYSLGEAEYSDGQSTASYTAGDASLLYRFYDSRDRRPRGTVFGTSLYGRFGFGFMQRDSDLSLDTDTPVYFGAGAGIETYLSYNLAVRLEGLFHDTDAGSATLSLVSRFGGRRAVPAALPPVVRTPATPPTPTPPIPQIPTTPATPATPATLESLESLESVDSVDTAVTNIAVQERAIPVPTDLPETYEIPPTGLPSLDTQPDLTNDGSAIPDEIRDAAVPQTPVLTADAAGSELPEVAITGTAGAGTIPEVELFGESDSETTSEVEIPVSTDAGIIPEVELLADPEDDGLPEVEIIGTTLETQEEPEVITLPPIDSDADGVMDNQDQCPESTPGYPVTARGCPAFGGILPDLIFNDRTADLASSSNPALDNLVQQLSDFPDTYIELVAHTDDTGTEAEQSELTRQRLRSIGVYLVRHGISQDRLLLRSYGGSRPAFDNLTPESRRLNNRIEVFENP